MPQNRKLPTNTCMPTDTITKPRSSQYNPVIRPAAIAAGRFPADRVAPVPSLNVQFDAADLPRVIYIDHYGNAWTGIRGGLVELTSGVEVKGLALPWRRTFAEAPKGEAFWHVNSVGLVEIAANRASAATQLGLKVGDVVRLAGSRESRLH